MNHVAGNQPRTTALLTAVGPTLAASAMFLRPMASASSLAVIMGAAYPQFVDACKSTISGLPAADVKLYAGTMAKDAPEFPEIGARLTRIREVFSGGMTRATTVPETVTVHVPFRIVKRGGRKEMQLPESTAQTRRTDNTLVKALARAFRWKRMLETGEFANIAELAKREGISPSYMTRVLRLTLLAPSIVEAILDGRQGPKVTLTRVLGPFPVGWNAQYR